MHAAIREDPTAAPKEEWSGDRAKYKRQIKVRKGREGGREGGRGGGGEGASGWTPPLPPRNVCECFMSPLSGMAGALVWIIRSSSSFLLLPPPPSSPPLPSFLSLLPFSPFPTPLTHSSRTRSARPAWRRRRRPWRRLPVPATRWRRRTTSRAPWHEEGGGGEGGRGGGRGCRARGAWAMTSQGGERGKKNQKHDLTTCNHHV